LTTSWAAYRRSLLELATAAPRAEVMAGVGVSLARAMGVRATTELLSGDRWRPHPAAAVLDVPSDLAGPDLLGRALEVLLDPADRHADGAYYTPPAIADGLVAEALGGPAPVADPGVVCDPAVGGGVFLLAAARALLARGVDPGEIVADRLRGVDRDELAVAVARASLALWAASRGRRADPPPAHLVVADFLDAGLDLGDAFGLVVGNPPFQGQLGSDTARDRSEAEAAGRWLGGSVHGYADTSALFLVAGVRRTRPGGRVALLQPMSFLGAAHVAGARAELLRRTRLRALWVADAKVFAADVAVCAPVLEVGPPDPRSPVRLTIGPGFEPAAEVDGPGRSWARLAARNAGVPDVDLPSDGAASVLGAVASATAGFRQQFYGLRPHVSEEGAGAPLVTCGLIDPLRCRWGEAQTRFGGRRWTRPAVDLDALTAADPALAGWVRARLVPKVVVATQARVIEAAVDPSGEWVPSVPLVAVEAPPEQLWEVAAVLTAPAMSALALLDAWGTGMATDTVRLSARQLLALPLPLDRARWQAAATELERAAPAWPEGAAAFGAEMNAAYGLAPDHPSLAWWLDRLPARR
jgi:hypothetical protein